MTQPADSVLVLNHGRHGGHGHIWSPQERAILRLGEMAKRLADSNQ
jgi:hypothetical protein